ncbi:MAG TPA: NUDIX hydrolase [Opitutales bacterium]|nr:NUDIX hydrolase [Opitutales bacterium]
MSIQSKNSEPREWEIQSRHLHADCRVFSVLRKKCKHPDRDSTRDFFSLSSPDWVNVVAVTPQREVLLIKQFRFGVEDFALEIPGGIIDEGEDAVTAGLRELKEETGYVGENARIIGNVWPNPAIMDNRCWFVLVKNVVKKFESEWDGDEEIGVSLEEMETVFRMVEEGTIKHALVVSALSLFRAIWAEKPG